MADTPESIIHSLRQGMGQFAMTTYYQLCGLVPVQDAAQKTLDVIDSVRKLFLEESSVNWRTFMIDLIEARRDHLIKLCNDHPDMDDSIKVEIDSELSCLAEIYGRIYVTKVKEYKVE